MTPATSTAHVSRIAWVVWTLAPPLLAAALLVGVVAWGNGGIDRVVRTRRPRPAFSPRTCNWRCHNHGCRHGMRVVGPPLAGPTRNGRVGGLFGWTVQALHATGSYRTANLLVFCLLWPALALGLWSWVVWQGLQLRTLPRVEDVAPGGAP